MPRPMPRPAPVTIATLPSTMPGISGFPSHSLFLSRGAGEVASEASRWG
jgi:hypothetical protein